MLVFLVEAELQGRVLRAEVGHGFGQRRRAASLQLLDGLTEICLALPARLELLFDAGEDAALTLLERLDLLVGRRGRGSGSDGLDLGLQRGVGPLDLGVLAALGRQRGA